MKGCVCSFDVHDNISLIHTVIKWIILTLYIAFILNRLCPLESWTINPWTMEWFQQEAPHLYTHGDCAPVNHHESCSTLIINWSEFTSSSQFAPESSAEIAAKQSDSSWFCFESASPLGRLEWFCFSPYCCYYSWGSIELTFSSKKLLEIYLPTTTCNWATIRSLKVPSSWNCWSLFSPILFFK